MTIAQVAVTMAHAVITIAAVFVILTILAQMWRGQ